MGTSLSGLTPATTFDGLLKTSDNDALDATLKTIGTGDGTDSILQLSNSALKINGGQATIVGAGNDNTTISLLVQNSDGTQLLKMVNDGSSILGNDTHNVNVESNGYVNINSNRVYSTGSRFYYNDGNGYIARLDAAGFQVGNASSAASATIHAKGSGATSATTSLLVQNSAGSELFKVQDDGRVDLGDLYLTGSTFFKGAASLDVDNDMNYRGYSSHIFRVYNGSGGYLETMRITGNTAEPKVGIGETTPTARLHVKGSGNTNTTTSLLVQNSDGADMLNVQDNGTVVFGLPNASQSLQIANIGSSTITFSGPSNLTMYATTLRLAASVNASYVGSQTFNIGVDSSLGARLGIKGTGATSATTALLVQNSAGDSYFNVKDDGDFGLGAATNSLSGSNNNIFFRATNTYFRASGGAYLGNFREEGFQIGNGGSTATARLQVKGSGATSATTALLVQNSAGSDLLKVNDAGEVSATTFYAGASIVRQNQFRINQQWLSSGTGGLGIRIGTNVAGPHDSAKLEVDSTTQGFLPPRMTTTQRDAISSPASGLMVYNTTTNKAQCYNGTAWQDLF